MMESHHTGRVDQHVPPLLDGVGSRNPGKPPPERLTAIGPHGSEAPQVAEPGLVHAVRQVERPVGVYKKWPDQPGLVQVLSGLLRSFEGHHERLNLKPSQLLARLLQLQQMSATGQSEQMPVKHQKQPPAAVVFEVVLPTVGVAQHKVYRRPADEP